METNSLSMFGINGNEYHAIPRRKVMFEDIKPTDKVEMERLRLFADMPGYFDVSYCYMVINGEQCIVSLPERLIPKARWKTYLVDLCKKQGIYIKNLFVNVSTIR